MFTRHSRPLSAAFIILLLVVLPASIDFFHNHDDAHIHHDCPVHQWESTFVMACVVSFGLIVIFHSYRFTVPEAVRVMPGAFPTGFNRRAPPLACS